MEFFFSPTQMNMFSGCAAQYYQRYILGQKVPPGIALHMGSGLHAAAAGNFTQKIESREDIPLSDMKERASASFDHRIAEDGVYMSAEDKPRASTIIGEAKDKTIKMTGVLHREVSPLVQPVVVEKDIEFTRYALPEVTFKGIVDVIDEKEHDVIDIKTSKNRWGAGKAENEMQPVFYLPGARALGLNSEKFLFHIVTKAKTPAHQVVTTTRDESDLVALEARARMMIQAIKAGVFPPVEMGHWRCNPLYCGWFMTCKYRSERDKNKYISIG